MLSPLLYFFVAQVSRRRFRALVRSLRTPRDFLPILDFRKKKTAADSPRKRKDSPNRITAEARFHRMLVLETVLRDRWVTALAPRLLNVRNLLTAEEDAVVEGTEAAVMREAGAKVFIPLVGTVEIRSVTRKMLVLVNGAAVFRALVTRLPHLAALAASQREVATRMLLKVCCVFRLF